MRLIDADELMEHVWRDKLDSRELIAAMIENAPTINMTEEEKKLLEAAKAISENCLNRQYVEDCDKCPFRHKGHSYLANFCIVQEDVRRWAEYIEDMLLPEPPKGE